MKRLSFIFIVFSFLSGGCKIHQSNQFDRYTLIWYHEFNLIDQKDSIYKISSYPIVFYKSKKYLYSGDCLCEYIEDFEFVENTYDPFESYSTRYDAINNSITDAEKYDSARMVRATSAREFKKRVDCLYPNSTPPKHVFDSIKNIFLERLPKYNYYYGKNFYSFKGNKSTLVTAFKFKAVCLKTQKNICTSYRKKLCHNLYSEPRDGFDKGKHMEKIYVFDSYNSKPLTRQEMKRLNLENISVDSIRVDEWYSIPRIIGPYR